jgi:capsular polysaccharide transport system permease protein
MFARAQDQYVSYVGFSVRSEDVGSALDILGGLGSIGGGGAEDQSILYEYLQSQELVRALSKKIDLKKAYATTYDLDPIFSFNPDGTIEDLTKYWGRMTKVFYDSSTGLIELRVHAFDAAEAKAIADFIFAKSSEMINELSDAAREDATRYAREELDHAVARLRLARQAGTTFRSENQVVDPAAEIGAQTGLLSELQARLSNALITYDLLKESASANDPRLEQALLRIEVIQQRIKEEREKYANTGAGGSDFSALVGEYEGLAVDREFAERAYLAALAAYDSAQTTAQRKSKYLAAYIKPTLAERAEYPLRSVSIALVGGFLLMAWMIGALIFYAIKDRR